ncbi:tripartite tricarboxylate transporter permease [Candidatus Micrarchaeota archaeon]|nr:tripartite tricarboxylate transporter permease [Candidatus Micrarchaeota archaeon]
MIEILIGLLGGLLSGLIPGLHSNTLTSVMLSLGMDPVMTAYGIILMYGTYCIVSFLPALFLGIPDERVVLAVLPGHKMVLEGKGLRALKIMVFSAVGAGIISLLLIPFSLLAYPIVYGIIRPFLMYVLVGATAVLLGRSRTPVKAAAVFLIAGIIGKVTLGFGLEDPFLPLFGGLYGISSLLTYKHKEVKKQKESGVGKELIAYILLGVLLGWTADLLPGISSPSQMATFSSIIVPLNNVGYLATIASIGVSQGVFALATDASIGKARVGAIVGVGELIDVGEYLPILAGLLFIGIGIGAGFVYLIRNKVSEISRFDMSKFNVLLGIYLFALSFLVNGWIGLVVMVVCSALGYLCIRIGVERMMLMGVIIIPTILLLL